MLHPSTDFCSNSGMEGVYRASDPLNESVTKVDPLHRPVVLFQPLYSEF
jgi:hypothetical protein